jgi:hypothetical protein
VEGEEMSNMKIYAKTLLSALMLAGASFAFSAPAAAQVDFGISFGYGDGFTGFDPCDYYDYYDEPPPWGLPDDYCDYPVYYEPVFFDGYWYRGPIYYRWNHGRRVFWLNGGWRDTHWSGSPPQHIRWENRGGHFRNGFRPGIGFHGGGRDWRADGVGGHRWHGNDDGGRGNGGGDRHPWNGGDHPWFGNRGGDDRRHDGGGDRGGDHGGGNHFGGDRGGDHGGGGDGGGHSGGGGGGSHSGGGGGGHSGGGGGHSGGSGGGGGSNHH